ncbi:hypothetical protein F5888DRAFT_1867175 [Russula emetica]|nr:hypothetical protein F5888DRAFT_1867175 [Russula emetica]
MAQQPDFDVVNNTLQVITNNVQAQKAQNAQMVQILEDVNEALGGPPPYKTLQLHDSTGLSDTLPPGHRGPPGHKESASRIHSSQSPHRLTTFGTRREAEDKNVSFLCSQQNPTTPTLPFRSARPHQRNEPGIALRLLIVRRTNRSPAGTHEGVASQFNSSAAVADRRLARLRWSYLKNDDSDSIQGQKQKVSSVLLSLQCTVVDVDDPISVVEEILARDAKRKDWMKIYKPTHVLLDARIIFYHALAPPSTVTGRLLKGGTTDILSAARHVLIDWNHQKKIQSKLLCIMTISTVPFFSELPALHAAHIPSIIPGSGGQVAPGPETTGQALIVNALGAPFVLEGLIGEADTEAIDAEPDSELAASR